MVQKRTTQIQPEFQNHGLFEIVSLGNFFREHGYIDQMVNKKWNKLARLIERQI